MFCETLSRNFILQKNDNPECNLKQSSEGNMFLIQADILKFNLRIL